MQVSITGFRETLAGRRPPTADRCLSLSSLEGVLLVSNGRVSKEVRKKGRMEVSITGFRETLAVHRSLLVSLLLGGLFLVSIGRVSKEVRKEVRK